MIQTANMKRKYGHKELRDYLCLPFHKEINSYLRDSDKKDEQLDAIALKIDESLNEA